jgi:hypothetical protein
MGIFDGRVGYEDFPSSFAGDLCGYVKKSLKDNSSFLRNNAVLHSITSFSALPDLPTKNVIWRSKDISKVKLASVGDMFFDFAVIDKHIQTHSDPAPSYIDYGFGSDRRVFSGSQRFVVTRHERIRNMEEDEKAGLLQTEKEDGYVELSIECFRCNPLVDRDSWAEYAPWLHYWYAKCLWAEAVRRLLRR